jgi:hypothetical protein
MDEEKNNGETVDTNGETGTTEQTVDTNGETGTTDQTVDTNAQTEITSGMYTNGKLNNKFMEYARGRVLFMLSEINRKEELKNFVKSQFGSNKENAAFERGVKYKEALQYIIDNNREDGLGSYSVVGNAFNKAVNNVRNIPNAVGNKLSQAKDLTKNLTKRMFGYSGGKHKKNRRTRHKRKN